MQVEEHPAYQEEKDHLLETIGIIESKSKNVLKDFGVENMYAPPDTIRIFSNQAASELNKCKAALRDLYSGRVDWKSRDDSAPEIFYIGKSPLYPYIYAWQDTLASDLYYNRATGREDGELLLVRTFLIEDQVIKVIEDNFQDPSVTGELDPDSLLARILRDSRGQLQEIIATINAQQNRIIRAPLGESLIVQGVPGSGKTVIALHRVAYLLYNYKDLRPQNILVLGPNPIYMQYISQVLPSLGERQIPQVTFDQWVMDQLGEKIAYQSQEELLELLLSSEYPLAEKVMHLRNCLNMGSLKMGKLLDRYVERLRQDVLEGRSNLVCRYQLLGTAGKHPQPIFVERNLEMIQSVMADVKALPLNQQREAVELRLTNEITSEVLRQLGSLIQDRERRTKEIFDIIKNQVHEFFSNWRDQNVSVAYRRLFRQRGILQDLGEDLFNRWELELMGIDAPTAQRPFRFSDLVGLLYFKILLEGTDNLSYGHIVIDEAQDIPPLFFDGLSRFIPKKSITILGDIGQGVFLNYGLSNWDELQSVFPTIGKTIEELQICYRSTWEIMQFANDVLRRTGIDDTELIRPLNRSGKMVALYPTLSEIELVRQVITCIQHGQQSGWKSIAIICKSARACHKLSELIQEEGFSGFQLVTDRNSSFHSNILVLPAYLAKGLEFDIVILADGHRYPNDDLSLRLLFVAITRAAHELNICWQGEISPLLDTQIEHVDILPFLPEREQTTTMTIHDYAEANRLEADWCVELLARSGRLPLVFEGVIDTIVMDLIIQTSKSMPRPSPEETFVDELTPALRDKVISQVQVWQEQDELHAALTLPQTTYGLLHNHIRSLGLERGNDGKLRLPEQVVILVRLRKLIEAANLSLPGGRWTTHQRLDEEVDSSQLQFHREILQTLFDFGVIETQQSANSRQQIRVNPQWIRDLLDLSIGIQPQGLDTDLLERLPKLPSGLDLSAEVQS